MIAFQSDHAEDMKNPEYAYQFGRNERELEIIKLLEAEQLHDPDVVECHCGSWREAIGLIKGEK